MQKTLGIVIGRFQVPDLHAGHRHLIDTARRQTDDLLILIGTSEALPTIRNPLPFAVREAMVRQLYPDATVLPLPDQATDAIWSAHIDQVIEERFPEHTATLYGSRDSCIPHYLGRHAAVVIPPAPAPSGTEVRKANGKHLPVSREFRAGMIHAQAVRLPVSYQTVDIAVIRHEDRHVLLGQKSHDGDHWRFIGGFADPRDTSLEAAALRELHEEAGRIDTHGVRYLGSFRVEDYRYRGEADQVMTAFFMAYHMSGIAHAGDDLDEVAWFPAEAVPDIVVPSHRPLAERLIETLKGEPS